VEFALLAPVLFSLVIGGIEFGMLINARNMVSNAVRDGARLGSLQQSPTQIQDAVTATLSKIPSATYDTPIAACKNSAGTSVTCGPSATGGQVSVTATLHYKGLTGFFGTMLTMDIVRTEVMRVE
jgi:Flp pilus assembly protein TadG